MPNPQELIAKSEDTYDLLEHIAWTDVIVPELAKHREFLSKQLVSSVLGNKSVNVQTKEIISVEQLAGKIFGIDYIEDLLKKILRNGNKAFDDLNK